MPAQTSGQAAATEVLIPEARRHQRRRYRRRGVAAVIAILVAAVLVVSALLLFRGPSASGHAQPRPTPPGAGGHAAGVVYFRPVLCYAPAYAPPTGPSGDRTPAARRAAPRGDGAIPACSPSAALTETNLGVRPSAGPGSADGFRSNDVAPDPQFAPDPSTSVRAPGYAARSVLLPALAGSASQGGPGTRYVLGPAVMSSHNIGRATVVHGPGGQWMVAYTMDAADSALWDKVAAANFHRLLGIELDGVVYSAPLMQPAQSSFSSFEGRGEISGGLTHAEAVQLARQLQRPTAPDRTR